MENEPSRACFRFYAELNDHLPQEQQYKTLEKAFFTSSTVTDSESAIESRRLELWRHWE